MKLYQHNRFWWVYTLCHKWINFDDLSTKDLPYELIVKLKDYINVERYIMYNEPDEEMIEKLMTLFNKDLSKKFIKVSIRYGHVSESFVRRHLDLFDDECWALASYHVKLSEDFITTYLDKLHIANIVKRQQLSTDFLEAHYKDLPFKLVQQYQKLSLAFLETHYDDLDLLIVTTYQTLSNEFIIYHFNDLKKYMGNILIFQHVGDDLKKKIKESKLEIGEGYL